MILSIVLTKAKENPLTELLSPKGGLLYLVLTAHEPSIKPLADVVSCYICSDRQYKRKNTFHFSHLPSRINGRARPQTHYTTRFAKKIQEMPRAGLSYRGKASLRTTSQSASQTAPLVGEPLAKPFTLRGLPKPPLLGATATTAASGGNREELLGPRPAGCERQRSRRWEPQPGQWQRVSADGEVELLPLWESCHACGVTERAP